MVQKKIAALVLAAGASTRLGVPKQLLKLNGTTLLERLLTEIHNSQINNITVVLGAQYFEILDSLSSFEICIVENENWQEGIGSSIRKGIIQILQNNETLDGVLLFLCDQPYVTSSLINQIVNQFYESDLDIVTCNFGKDFGPPTLFSKSLFNDLSQLAGDHGAKKIIKSNSYSIAYVDFPLGIFDIDSVQDFDMISKMI